MSNLLLKAHAEQVDNGVPCYLPRQALASLPLSKHFRCSGNVLINARDQSMAAPRW